MGTTITTSDECKAAAFYLGSIFQWEVGSTDDRPAGCYRPAGTKKAWFNPPMINPANTSPDTGYVGLCRIGISNTKSYITFSIVFNGRQSYLLYIINITLFSSSMQC